MLWIEEEKRISPEIEELIRESERLRVLNSLAELKDGYLSNEVIRSVCGFKLEE